jgi:hypothetical protein
MTIARKYQISLESTPYYHIMIYFYVNPTMCQLRRSNLIQLNLVMFVPML